MKTVHQGMRIYCEIPGCNQNYTRKEYYKTHVKKHHANLGEVELEIMMKRIRDMAPI